MSDKKPMGASPVMPWSPLDALLDALPAIRKAGKVTKDDNVMTVQQRMADVYVPIVKRIQEEARRDAQAENERLRSALEEIAEECKVFDGACEWGHKEEFAAIRTKARAALRTGKGR